MHFVGGILAGGAICLLIIRLSGLALVSEKDLEKQVHLLTDLQKENAELIDDLFYAPWWRMPVSRRCRPADS